jgi:hypothetical protein
MNLQTKGAQESDSSPEKCHPERKNLGRGIGMYRIMIGGCSAVLALAAWMAPATTTAHHSFAAEFDYDLTGTIEGEVIEVLFVNPHARFFVAVKDESGAEVIWDTQTSSINSLTRFGWDEDTIEVGQRVRMQGNLGRDGARKLWIREVVTESGRIIRPVAGGADIEGESK